MLDDPSLTQLAVRWTGVSWPFMKFIERNRDVTFADAEQKAGANHNCPQLPC